MANHLKFQISLGAADARTILETALSEQGYRIAWHNEQEGLAEKGSKAKAMFLGAFAMHYKYNLRVDPAPDGTAIAAVFLGNTGIAGGAMGIAKVRNELDRLSTVIRPAYEAKGVLNGVDLG
jgi:hypothetical protein